MCTVFVGVTQLYEGAHRMQGQLLQARRIRQETHKAALMQ